MAKIERVKPKEEKVIRVTLDVSYNDIIRTHYFAPEQLEEQKEEATRLTNNYKITVGDRNYLGKLGITLEEPTDKEKPIVFITKFQDDAVEESILALCANTLKKLNVIEKQIKNTLKNLEKAEETITEV